MADSSSSPPVSLELLIHEIEAMPREYWTELLDALRQFREKIPSTTPPVINAEQAKKNQAAIDLLDSWLSETEDASEHQQAWDFLKTALDEPKAGSPRFCPPPDREKDGAIAVFRRLRTLNPLLSKGFSHLICPSPAQTPLY